MESVVDQASTKITPTTNDGCHDDTLPVHVELAPLDGGHSRNSLRRQGRMLHKKTMRQISAIRARLERQQAATATATAKLRKARAELTMQLEADMELSRAYHGHYAAIIQRRWRFYHDPLATMPPPWIKTLEPAITGGWRGGQITNALHEALDQEEQAHPGDVWEARTFDTCVDTNPSNNQFSTPVTSPNALDEDDADEYNDEWGGPRHRSHADTVTTTMATVYASDFAPGTFLNDSDAAEQVLVHDTLDGSSPMSYVNLDTCSGYTLTGDARLLSNIRQAKKALRMSGITASKCLVTMCGDMRIRVQSRDTGQWRIIHLEGVLLGPPSTPRLLMSAEACAKELHLTSSAKWVRLGSAHDATDVNITYAKGHTVFAAEFLTPPNIARKTPDDSAVDHVVYKQPPRDTAAARRRMFYLERRARNASVLALTIDRKNKVSAADWHKRLGHANTWACAVALGQQNLLHGHHTMPTCPVCVMARQRAAARVSSAAKAKTQSDQRPRGDFETYERIHIDIIGRLQEKSIGGSWWYLVIRDHATGLIHSYGMKRKNEVRDKLRHHILHVIRPVRPTGKVELQTDTESSLSESWKLWAKKNNVELRQSEPDCQWRNGVIEALVDKLKGMTRALLIDSGLPVKYHGYAVQHAVQILNALPRDAKEQRSPHKLAYGTDYNLRRFRRFGCVALRKNFASTLRGFDSRSIPGLYLGNAPRGYKDGWLHNSSLGKNKTAISRSMVFMENNSTPSLQLLAAVKREGGAEDAEANDGKLEHFCGTENIAWSGDTISTLQEAEGAAIAGTVVNTRASAKHRDITDDDDESDSGDDNSDSVDDGSDDDTSDDNAADWDFRHLRNSVCEGCGFTPKQKFGDSLTRSECAEVGLMPCRCCNLVSCKDCVEQVGMLASFPSEKTQQLVCHECVKVHGEVLGIRNITAADGATTPLAEAASSHVHSAPTPKRRPRKAAGTKRNGILWFKHGRRQSIADAAERWEVDENDYLEWLRSFPNFCEARLRTVYPAGHEWPDPRCDAFVNTQPVTVAYVFNTEGMEQHLRGKSAPPVVTPPPDTPSSKPDDTFGKTIHNMKKEFFSSHGQWAEKYAPPTSKELDAMVPKNQKEARASPYHVHFKAAELRELQGLLEMGTFRQVRAPSGRNLVKLRFVYDIKRNADRSISKFKARLVAQGFTQKKHDDYDLTIAPVAHVSSLRTLFALAARDRAHIKTFDVSQAFLCTKGALEHDIYCRMPPGFESPGDALKLQAGLYGLKQGSQLWASVFSKWLQKQGWKRCVQDPCIYYRRGARLGVWVDDCAITCEDLAEIDIFERELSGQYKITGGEQCTYILGTHVQYKDNGEIKLHQEKYINESLERFKLQNCVPVDNPIDPDNLMVHEPVTDEQAAIAAKMVPNVRSMVGALTWLSCMSRPDIAFAVHSVQRQSHKPGPAHHQACVRIWKYLAGTKDRGIVYHPASALSPEQHRLTVFSDADFAGQKTVAGERTCKSQSGGICFIAGGPVCWSSKLQRLTAQSSCESEFYALVAASKQTVALRQLLRELGEHELTEGGTVIATDNEAAITCSIQPTSLKNRHFALNVEFTRDCVRHEQVRVWYIPGDLNPADLYTKNSIRSPKFMELAPWVMGEKPFATPTPFIR